MLRRLLVFACTLALLWRGVPALDGWVRHVVADLAATRAAEKQPVPLPMTRIAAEPDRSDPKPPLPRSGSAETDLLRELRNAFKEDHR